MKKKTIESILEKNSGFRVKNIIDMTKEDFLEVPGIKEKKAEKIHTGIKEAIKKSPIDLMVAASNVFGAGVAERTIITLMKDYPTFFKTQEPNSVIESKLLKIPGLGDVTIQKLINKRIPFVRFTEDIGYQIPEAKQKDTGLKKKFVITGPRDKEVIKKIELLGGVLDKGVKKKTHMVIVTDTSRESKSVKDAKKYNIPILTMKEFMDL